MQSMNLYSQKQMQRTTPHPATNESSVVWSEGSYPKTPSCASMNKPAMDKNGKFRSRQVKIIVVGIIIGLSLVIIALTVTLAIFLKSTSTTATAGVVTTGYINGLISGTTQSANTPIIYDVGNGGISSDPPCSSHTVINDPLRNVNQPGIGGTCDNGPLFNTSIEGRWIRFIGTGGTMIPLSSPGANHCGAFLTAWFNGSLPSTIGTISPANICVESPTVLMCKLLLNTAVVNCGNFYVYFLQPLIMCNARYCTT